MRRTVARRLHKEAREIHQKSGRPTEEKLLGMRVPRGAANLSRRRWARFDQVKALEGRGYTHEIAERMVPQVELHSITVINGGPRATYQFLKQLYKSKRSDPR